MKHIAVGGFFHESNTFNPIVTGIEDFLIFEGAEIYANRDAYLLAKGIIEYFEARPEYEIIPLVFARAVPNGEVDEALYRSLKQRFFSLLAEVPQVDAFVLALHGSMRVKNIGSAESDLLDAIKARYPAIPIFCGLDMHATLTEEMLSAATALTGFKTAPHIDAYETGLKAAEMADIAFSHSLSLHMGAAKISALIAGEKSETECEPMKSLISELKRLEQDDEVLSASYFLGFPWADADENGVTAVVVTKADQARAEMYALQLAEMFQAHRKEFCFSAPAYPPDSALRLALRESSKPVLVSDSGDNPTAGSTADNTTIVRLLSTELKELATGKAILIAGIYDSCAVQTCRDNLNRSIELTLGGRFDTMYCQPVRLSGVPVAYCPCFGLLKSELVLFRTECFEVIITSKHIGYTNTEMFVALGIDYLGKDVIIVKLGYLTEDFREIAAKSYLALTCGCTDEVLERLCYHRRYDLI